MRFLVTLGLLVLCSGAVACAQPTLSVPRIDYIILEGGGPDQGPGGDVEENITALRQKMGPVDPESSRMYGYGVQQIRVLSRSVEVVAADVRRALDLAEETGVPVWLHIDP